MITPRITKRGKVWSAIINLPRVSPNEPRKQKRVSGKTKKEVQETIISIIAEINRGTYTEPTKQTFADYFEWWLDNSVRYNVAPITLEGYQCIVKNHLIPEFGNVPLASLQPFHIQQYYANSRKTGRRDGKAGVLSGTTLKQHHAVLRAALNEAVRLRMIPFNPVLSLRAPKAEKHTVRTLSAAELKHLISCFESNEFYIPVFIAAHTGARRSEILGLRWQDIDFNERIVRIVQTLTITNDGKINIGAGKTSYAQRAIDVSKEVIAVLRKHKAKQAELKLRKGAGYNDQDLVCAKEDGLP